MTENPLIRFVNTVYNIFDVPVTFVRENIVTPNQKKYPWYHQKFRRVPTVDQCYTDDFVCIAEANEQFFRDKKVDDAILKILRSRYENCMFMEDNDHETCRNLKLTYEEAATNWFTKYGDLGPGERFSKNALMKQKHRMAWERRHGPVGTGMKTESPEK